LEICGEAESENDALSLVRATNPDLVLVDLALKGGHGLELIKQIKSRHPNVKMLVVSGFMESLYAERALRAGASGYLNKQESNDRVIDAIRAVLRGEQYIGPEITQRLVGQALGSLDSPKTAIETLSDRELEIFRLIGSGITTSSIADQLIVSVHTIETHRENIKRKLGIKKATELSRAAVQWLLENEQS
jgi:DNA-binding NarL/FixJ family response regulator